MNIETASHAPDDGGDKLIRMASEIADFFKSYPDERAVAGVANHINRYWTPKMREEFLTASAGRDRSLSPLLMAARERIKRKKND